MKNLRKGVALAFVAGALFSAGGVGCAVKAPPQLPAAAVAEREIHVVMPGSDFEFTDRHSLDQQLAMALRLSGQGDFAQAASYYRQAARRQYNAFGERALLAAASSYLLAGDQAGFSDAMVEFRHRLGPARVATVPEEVEVLLALDAYYGGRAVTPPYAIEPIMPSSRGRRR